MRVFVVDISLDLEASLIDFLRGANHRAAQFCVGVIIASCEFLQHTLNTSHFHCGLPNLFVMLISHNKKIISYNSPKVNP